MIKAEVIAPVTMAVNVGSVVYLNEKQLDRLAPYVRVVEEKKKKTTKKSEE